MNDVYHKWFRLVYKVNNFDSYGAWYEGWKREIFALILGMNTDLLGIYQKSVNRFFFILSMFIDVIKIFEMTHIFQYYWYECAGLPM